MILSRTPTRSLVLLAFVAAGSSTLQAQALSSQTPPAQAPPVSPIAAGSTSSPGPKARSRAPRLPKSRRSDTPAYNTSLVLLDPAHGGSDNGSTLAQNALEKDTTVAFALRLRALLQSKGFTVVLTHDSASADISPDQRIDLANRNHPFACLLLHASPGGHGVHLFTSALLPSRPGSLPLNAIVPYDTLQAPAVSQSLRLANDLATAFRAARTPLVLGQSSVRPIDSMTCPAVAVEVSPLQLSKDSTTLPSDPGYQQHVAETLTQALTLWRDHVLSGSPGTQPAPAPPSLKTGSQSTPRLQPKSVKPPVEIPESTSPAAPPLHPAPKAPKAPPPNAGPR